MGSLKEKEQILFDEWQRKRLGFVSDGVVNEELYLNSKPKIVYILKEVNGGANWDLRDYLMSGARSQTWNNIARWTHGIRQVYENTGISIPWNEIYDVDLEFRKAQLQSICAVNVKKESGGSSADDNAVWDYMQQDKDFILRQLEIYNADVVICCGIGYPNTSNVEWKMTLRGIRYGLDGNSIVISYVHPEVRCPANLVYYSLIDAVKEIASSH